MIIDKLVSDFNKIFKTKEKVEVFFSPGRVNLIGEHIDYNGGYVFPCALDFGIYAIVKKRRDNVCNFYSKNFKVLGITSFSLEKLIKEKKHGWVNYPKGVIKFLQDKGYKIDCGLDIFFYGNIPNGAGLSSSASIEVLMGTVLKSLFDLDISMFELVQLCQRVENEFIGVKCGIMDQFIIGMGKKDKAILLDCETLDYEYKEIILKDSSIIIANTNKKRGLETSKYNERRETCESALEKFKKNKIDIRNLCDLTPEEFEKNKYLLNDIESKRAKHAVYENYRVLSAAKKLFDKDIEGFGKLMNESHISLRDDYEVSCFELDTMVESAWQSEGVIGSRMTGAGFGGCTVSIVKNSCVEKFIKNVGEEYLKKTSLKPEFYTANISDGARKIGDFN